MLAGRVKLKRLLLYAVCLAITLLAGLVVWCTRPPPYVAPEPDNTYVALDDPALALRHDEPAAEPAAAASYLDAVLAFRGKDLGTAKVKDARSGETWKVNLYQDEGEATVNRAKVDLDRDEKWDEKWTFDGDAVSRQVAPQDDEVYAETWLYSPQGWYLEGSEPPSAAPEVVPEEVPAAAAAPSEPWTAVVMSYRGEDIGSTKLKDVTKGKPFKVNVYQDEGNASANRAKVDIDRDDKWDQKWTFDESGASVKIAPNDDEDYGEARRWTDEGWGVE